MNYWKLWNINKITTLALAWEIWLSNELASSSVSINNRLKLVLLENEEFSTWLNYDEPFLKWDYVNIV